MAVWASGVWAVDVWADGVWEGMGSTSSGLQLGYAKIFRNKADSVVQPRIIRSGFLVFKRTT
jgi:hypothetical protein